MDSYLLHSLGKELKNPSAFVLYLYFYSFVDPGIRTELQLSHQELVKATGLTKSTVIKCTRFLAEKGFVKIDKPFPTKAPLYTILFPWKTIEDTRSKTTPATSKPVKAKKRKSKVDLALESIEQRYHLKLDHFKKALSPKEQKEFIDDFRKRKNLHKMDDETVVKLAVAKWFEISVVG